MATATSTNRSADGPLVAHFGIFEVWRGAPIINLMTIHDKLERHDVWWLFDSQLSGGPEGLGKYLQTLLDRCIEWFNVSGASLFLLDDHSGRYELSCRGGSDSTVPDGSFIVAGSGIAGICIERRRPMLVADPRMEPQLKNRVTERPDVGTAIVVPLIAPSDEVIGVLNLARRTGMTPFNPTDERHVESLCAVISLAVNNARETAKNVAALERADAERAKLKAIVESLGVALLVTESSQEVTDFNGGAVELFGSPPTVSGAPATLQAEIRSAWRHVKANKSLHRRVHDVALDRSWTIAATRFGDGGMVTVVGDVSDHDRAQRELERVRYLAEIGKMTAGIAHEIRNPLTGIQTAAQLVQEVPSQAEELGRIIETEARKLNELCNEFLDISKPVLIETQAIRLNELVASVNRHHESEFADADVELVVQNDVADPIIQGDAYRLEQVYRNLLLNALQACESGGQVTVRVRAQGFAVMDTGHGIDQELRERVFAPFFTTKSRGSGLGLPIVRKIVDAHRGRIVLTSKPGQGAKFEVVLPRSVAA